MAGLADNQRMLTFDNWDLATTTDPSRLVQFRCVRLRWKLDAEQIKPWRSRIRSLAGIMFWDAEVGKEATQIAEYSTKMTPRPLRVSSAVTSFHGIVQSRDWLLESSSRVWNLDLRCL